MRHGEQGPGVRATLERMEHDAVTERRVRQARMAGAWNGFVLGFCANVALVYILSIAF